MKQIHFFKNYLFVLLIGTLLVSCSKKNDEELVKTDPKLTSFGFYVEDNEGIIAQDYVISEVTGTAINIALPKEVDKSELIARFTTTANAMVTVDGVPQQSGTTVQDFSTPVDYILTEGTVNARYTVSVVKAADYVWTRLGAFSEGETSNMVMKVNPKTGVPYILYQASNDVSAERKAFVAKFDDNLWSFVGSNQSISEGQVGSYLNIAFKNDGTPYVSFLDYTATVSQAATVRYFSGNSWATVGNKGFTEEKITYSSLEINPSDQQPVFLGTIDGRTGVLPRRALSVSTFNGSVWSINNQVSGRESSEQTTWQMARRVGNALYFAVLNNTSPLSYSIYKYENNAWTTIAVSGELEEGATNLNLRGFGMDADAQGNVYVIVADNATGVYQPRVKKYDIETKTWSQTGSALPIDINSIRYVSLAISPLGVPYVLYRNEQSFPAVVSLDSETKDWTIPTVLESAVTSSTEIYLDFAPNGVGYAAFVNDATNNVVLHKYDVPNK